MTGSRLLILVAYDIADAKRLAKARRLVMAFAVSGQKSFYECWVTPGELKKLASDMKALVNAEEDRIHFFELHEREFTLFLGEVRRQSTEPFLVI